MQQVYWSIAFVLKIRLNYPLFIKNVICIEKGSEMWYNIN